MKAGRGIYDCGDVSVTTARSARLKNCYTKARKWDRGGTHVKHMGEILKARTVHVAFPLGKRI